MYVFEIHEDGEVIESDVFDSKTKAIAHLAEFAVKEPNIDIDSVFEAIKWYRDKGYISYMNYWEEGDIYRFTECSLEIREDDD